MNSAPKQTMKTTSKVTSKSRLKKAPASSKPEIMKVTTKGISNESSTSTSPEDTITLNRNHFYIALIVLAFSAGILVGFIAWSRGPVVAQTTVPNQPVAQVPVQTQTPRRYDIPTQGFPSLGPEDAPIVIIEFSDFQCPFCKRFFDETLKPLMAAYPGKIRFVYRHLPLTSIHANAFPAAEASMCANEQDSFWQFHDKIFENQDKLGRELYLQIASDLGLEGAAFEDCVNSGKYKDFVQNDLDYALSLGASSTPTFFINGFAVVGAQPLSVFQQVIDKELAGGIPK